MSVPRPQYNPEEHRAQLLRILEEFHLLEEISPKKFDKVLNRFPKSKGRSFSKAELIQGVRTFGNDWGFDVPAFVRKLRMKPVRSESGVAVVAVLTKPFPCPGECIFCPNDVRMPKSYLSQEPGAQRAARNRFDPFAQVLDRLQAFWANGHPTDKIELIVLGGTWSFYPDAYQIWFVKRCFDALNTYNPCCAEGQVEQGLDYSLLDDDLDGRSLSERYNERVGRFLRVHNKGNLLADAEQASWGELEAAHRENEGASSRCVGLVLETRPDCIDEDEAVKLRRLGATKVQMGVQSLSDRVLRLNKRGHTLNDSRRAFRLLRQMGFKIHAHWMPNLYGSTWQHDVEEFGRLFSDQGLIPDELKIYPCSLVETAELMQHYENGQYRPYTREELLEVLTCAISQTPRFCRLTRVVRDIPSTDIFEGNKTTNFREIAEKEAARRSLILRDIRAREIKAEPVVQDSLSLKETWYQTTVSQECFLEFVQEGDRLVSFLRLSLPTQPGFLSSLRGQALIREVHVYGRVAPFRTSSDGQAQHLGLGKKLVAEAERIARERGFDAISVISAVGTRKYYRSLGYEDGPLYQSKSISRRRVRSGHHGMNTASHEEVTLNGH